MFVKIENTVVVSVASQKPDHSWMEVGTDVFAASRELTYLLACKYDENGLTPRDQVEAPTLDGDTLTFPAYPVGTVVEVSDITGGELLTTITDPSGTIGFDDPGAYEVEVIPPLPWIGLRMRVAL